MPVLPASITKEFLTCQVCLDNYKSPKILPCLHTFCQACLQQYTNEVSRECGSSFPCPVCRMQTSVPSEGTAAKFKTNFFMENLMDAMAKLEQTDGGRLCQGCQEQNIVVSHCIECEDFLCQVCTDAHKRVRVVQEHKILSISELASGDFDEEIKKRQKQKCSLHHEPCTLFCSECKSTICMNCKVTTHDQHPALAISDQVRENRVSLETNLQQINVRLATMEQYAKNLSDYESEIDVENGIAQNDIRERETMINDVILKHKDELMKRLDQIVFTEKCDIKTYNDLILQHAAALKQASEVTNQILKYGSDREIVSMSVDLQTKLEQLQQIPCVDLVHKQRLKLHFLIPDDENNVTLIRNSYGELESKILGSVFTPRVVKGICLFSFDCSSITDEKECYVRCMAVSFDNNVIVLDGNNYKVKVFNARGNLVGEFSLMERIRHPVGLDILSDGKIAVLDEIKGIRVFSRSGKYVGSIETHTASPYGFCVKDKHLYVTDRKMKNINVVTQTGNLVRTIPNTTSPSVLQKPCNVLCTKSGHVLVADLQDHAVKLLDYEGCLKASYGRKGKSESQLNLPVSLCIDEHQNILVADYYNQRIHLLTKDCKFVTCVADKSNGMTKPTAVVVNNEGLLLAAKDTGSIEVYKYIV